MDLPIAPAKPGDGAAKLVERVFAATGGRDHEADLGALTVRGS